MPLIAKKQAATLCDIDFVNIINSDAQYIPPTTSFYVGLIFRCDFLKESLTAGSGFISQHLCSGYITPDNAQKSRDKGDKT